VDSARNIGMSFTTPFPRQPKTADPSSRTESGRPRLSVVAPCFNEAQGLAEFHRRVTAVCTAVVGTDYEFILINDGSTDATLLTMAQLSAIDAHLLVINMTRNYGHQAALTAGFEYCRGERILVLDADLQDPPELLGEMMVLMDSADVVYGQRRIRKGETWLKTVSASIFYRLLHRLVDIEIPLDTGDFRLISRQVLDLLNAMPEQHRFIRGMISWIGLTQVPIVYDRDARFAGGTRYPLGKMLRLAFDGITGFSIVPLRLASCFGFFTGAIGVSMLAYSVGAWLFGHTVAGWASLTTIILILGSVQLVVLGIIGEYLGRLYLESKHRPVYLVDRIIGQNRPAARFEMPVLAPPAAE